MSRFLNPRLRSMEAYVPGAQPQRKKVVKLNTNESPFPPSPKVEWALAKAVSSLNRYPDLTSGPLVNALCAKDGVSPTEVIVGNGSDEILAFAILAFGDRGVRFPDITYGFYPVWAELFGFEKKLVPLAPDFSVVPTDYRDDGSMILLANPNAPTGRALTVDQIEGVLKENPSCVVVVDEAYYGFGAETCAPLIRAYDNLLVVRTFSKSYALAGGRIGYALGSAPLVEDLNKIRYSFNPYNLGTLSMLAAAAAIEDEIYYEEMRAKVVTKRDQVAVKLREMGFSVIPSQANFLFAKCEKMPGNQLQAMLEDRGTYVRRFDGLRIADYLRITIGGEEEMDEMTGQIADILKGEGLL